MVDTPQHKEHAMHPNGPLMLVNGTAEETCQVIIGIERDAAVVTAVHVARDWAIERIGNRPHAYSEVYRYIGQWLTRNGADADAGDGYQFSSTTDLVDAVWALAELPDQDPLNLVDDDYHNTSYEARDMLTAQYEADLTHALSRITWKA